MVQWDLFSWDAGMLNAVLQYMYLECKFRLPHARQLPVTI